VTLTLQDELLLPGFGEASQRALEIARVRAVGLNAVASAALAYLVEAGIGTLWLDDPERVSPADLGGWLFLPPDVGEPRVDAARTALSRLSRFVAIEPYPVGGVPSAALICAASDAQAFAAAEEARRARIPHVVIEADADGGAVVSVPPDAPCYACARSTGGAGRSPLPAIAALSALAAADLAQMIGSPDSVPGRRLDLVRGVVTARPTHRLPGCDCGVAAQRESDQ